MNVFTAEEGNIIEVKQHNDGCASYSDQCIVDTQRAVL
jgi:hypothetical protein